MLSFRNSVLPSDITAIRKMLKETGMFEQAPDEIDVAEELAQIALDHNNTGEYLFIFAQWGHQDEPAGFVCYGKTACTIATYDLFWICTQPRLQNKGIGKALIAEVIRRIREENGRKLVVQTGGREEYGNTQKFYEACGFQLEGRLKNYYAPGDDGLFYTMDFPQEEPGK